MFSREVESLELLLLFRVVAPGNLGPMNDVSVVVLQLPYTYAHQAGFKLNLKKNLMKRHLRKLF